MIKRISRHVLLLLFFFTVLFQLSAFQLFMPEDREVRELLSLYNRAGFVFPDASFPLSFADLDKYAARLLDLLDESEDDNLEVWVDKIRSYRDSLDFKSGRAVKGNNISIKPAAFLNGEAYIPDETSALAHTRFPNDFYNRFVDFPDMLYLELFAGHQGNSGLSISAGIKREYHQDNVPENNLFIRTSDDPAKIENYLIRSGYLAWKVEDFEFRLGRSPVHYGDADFSTFLPSEKLPWLDAFTYRYQVGPLTMTSYFGTLDSRMSEDEELIFIDNSQTVDSDAGSVGFDGDILEIGGIETDYIFEKTILLNSMHRFVLGWEKLRLGFTSMIVVARENNYILIGDIFPVFSWHNAIVGNHNMHLVFDFGYAPFPGLSIFGQAAWDDINASDLFGIPDSSLPTIGAYLLAAVYQPFRLAPDDNHLSTGLKMKAEFGKTHYLWGNYYAYHDGKGSYLSRAIYRYKGQKGVYWMPLTSPYGPGTWWVEGVVDYPLRPDFSLSFGFTYLRFQSAVNLFQTPYIRDESMQNSYDSSSFSMHLESIYCYKINKNNQLNFRFVPVWYSYKGHMWPELEISVEYLRSKVKDFK